MTTNTDDAAANTLQYPSTTTRRTNSNLKLNQQLSPDVLSEDDDFMFRSPTISDRSSGSSSISSKKPRRSYDKVYRTNEPLKGLPEIDDFEEKLWDDDPTNINLQQQQQQHHDDVVVDEPLIRTTSPIYTQPYHDNNKNSISRPDLVTNYNPNRYDSNDYTVPVISDDNNKTTKQRFSSQSSIVTDV